MLQVMLPGPEASPQTLLAGLKDLKNSLIGNVSRKASVAKDDVLLERIVACLGPASSSELTGYERETPSASTCLPTVCSPMVDLETHHECAVILSSLASTDFLVLEPLLRHSVPSALLSCLRSLRPFIDPKVSPDAVPEKERFITNKLIPSLCKALRNVYHSVGIEVFGYMNGVGVDIEIVDTGLFDESASDGRSNLGTSPASKAMDASSEGDLESRRSVDAHVLAKDALRWLYEPSNISVVLEVVTSPRTCFTNILLPLYQLLAQLTLLSHQVLVVLRDPLPYLPVSGPRPSSPWTSADRASYTDTNNIPPFIGDVFDRVLDPRTTTKVKQAGLDLLASLSFSEEGEDVIQGVNVVARAIWQALDRKDEGNQHDTADSVRTNPFLAMMKSRTAGLTAGAAAVLVNIARCLPGSRWVLNNYGLWESLIFLLDESREEQIKACFLIAKGSTIYPEVQLPQQHANSCLIKIIGTFKSVCDSKSTKLDNENVRARLQEGCLLAMSALSLADERARNQIIDAGLLPFIKDILSHPSYGIRAAACQVVRALSRSTAILRTTLVDGGVSEEVFKLLAAEEKRWSERRTSGRAPTGGRQDTVLIAATSTICNLVVEFSPAQTQMIDGGAIAVLGTLANLGSVEVRSAALSALRNMVYKSNMALKKRVVDAVGWNTIRSCVDSDSSDLRSAGLALLRNIISEGSDEEIDYAFSGLGQSEVLRMVLQGVTASQDRPECAEEALWVLFNISLGSEEHRNAVLGRSDLLLAVASVLTNDEPLVKLPAIGCFANLTETNDKHRKLRQAVVTKLTELIPSLEDSLDRLTKSHIYDIRNDATKLLTSIQAGKAATSRPT